ESRFSATPAFSSITVCGDSSLRLASFRNRSDCYHRMQPINVVGAGFSGLASAYFLTKAGRQVRLFEKSDRAGGLIRTIRTEHGLVETAANGLLNSERLEAMCSDIGVPLLPTLRDGRRRFIYRGKPRQLPLRVSELARVGFGLVKNVASLRPHPLESIS